VAGDVRAFDGGWWIAFVAACLPLLLWPVATIMAFIGMTSSGAADPREPEQVAGTITVALHTLYPLLLWGAWRLGIAWRRRGRPRAALALLLSLPTLSLTSLWLWFAVG
jgi:uncharacterized membrane protein